MSDGEVVADGRVRCKLVRTRPDGSEPLYRTVLFVQSAEQSLIDQVRGIGIPGHGSLGAAQP